MPIEQILDVLKDKPDLIQEIRDVFDKAGALEKVKSNNTDLTNQRTTWENEKKDLQAKIVNASKSDGTGNAELNALKEELQAVKTEIFTAKSEAQVATKAKLATDLKNSVIGLEVTAKRAINPNQLFTLMQTDNLVGFGDDGKAFYHRINDKGDVVKAANPSEAIDAFLKSNPHLEKSSGVIGSGQSAHKTASGGKFNPMDHL